MIQSIPKKINIGSNQKVLAATVDEEQTVHLILKNNALNKVQYGKYDIGKGEMLTQCTSLPTTASSFEEPASGNQGPAILDHAFGDCPVILLDAARVHHPLFFSEGTLQDPEWYWLGLPPINALASSIYNMPEFMQRSGLSGKERAFVALVVFKRQILTPIVMNNIPELVRALLSVLHESGESWAPCAELVMNELVDGQRNIIHVAIDKMAPDHQKKAAMEDKYKDVEMECRNALDMIVDAVSAIYDEDKGKELRLKVTQKLDARLENNSRSSVIRKPIDILPSLNVGPDIGPEIRVDRMFNDLHDAMNLSLGKNKESCLAVLLSHPTSISALPKLLKSKDAFGRTPFMYAIARRAYKEAVHIFHRAKQMVDETALEEGLDDDTSHTNMMEYLYPSNSPLDHNPMYVLCCNDTCSYTWTKEKHINQDIYECKTCGLTGSLCCCSECARTCHAGHECVLKKTSPTAYCDCLEKCPCRSQVDGDQDQRMELLELLLQNTKLVQYATGKVELTHIRSDC